MKYNQRRIRPWEETNPNGDMFVNFSLWNRLYQDFTTAEKREFKMRYDEFIKQGFKNNESQTLAMKTLLTARSGRVY